MQIRAIRVGRWEPVPPLLCGVAAGLFLLIWISAFLETYGSSAAVRSAMTVAFTLGILGSLALARRWWSNLAWLLPAAWTVALPWLLEGSVAAASGLSIETIAVPIVQFGWFLASACLCLSVPTAVVIAPAFRNSGDHRATFAAGVAAALITGPSAMAVLGTSTLLIVTVCGSASAAVLSVLRPQTDESGSTGRPATDHAGSGETAFPVTPLLICAAAGLLMWAAGQLNEQLVFAGRYITFARWAGFSLGIALGLAFSAVGDDDPLWRPFAAIRRWLNAIGERGGSGALLAACAWLLVAMPIGIRVILWQNAEVSHSVLIAAVRISVAISLTLPIGLALGLVCRSVGPAYSTSIAVAAGYLAASLSGFPFWWVLPATCAAIGIVVCAEQCLSLWERRPSTARRWALPLTVCGVPLVVISLLPALDLRGQTAHAHKLLYSTHTFTAYAQGTAYDELACLDGSRLVKIQAGPNAIRSVWTAQGAQRMVRTNGSPTGAISQSIATTPQSAVDVVPSVVALTLHKQPRRMLCVGSGVGMSPAVALQFPLTDIVLIEPHRDQLSLACEVSKLDPLADDRLQVVHAAPRLALSALGQSYDVILLNDRQPGDSGADGLFTRELYRQAAERLGTGGLVCQRLAHSDLGPRPIQAVIRTMQSVFPQVAIVQSVPGELLLIGANSDEPLVDETFLDRASATHVRAVLAGVDWDWSVLASRVVLTGDAVHEVCGTGPINHAGNSLLAAVVPHEVMRWGPKWTEVNELFSPHAGTLLGELAESPEVIEVNKRLEDVLERHALVHDHPDHFWAYRKSLKERLTKRPRTAVVPTSFGSGLERGLHPEDERRKAYLVALSRAVGKGRPVPAAIARLSDFAEPYDPLVTPFVHAEAARLSSQSDAPDRAAELEAWLHSVRFSSAGDRSIHNVAAAIELLCEHPEIIPDRQRRWDELQSLLDTLRIRWVWRSQQVKSSKYAASDARRSAEVTQLALQTLDGLQPQIDMSQHSWERRRSVLKSQLLKPLRKRAEFAIAGR